MPGRRPLHRFTTAFFVVVSLLFSHWALAAYVCPQQADAATMAERMASGQPCAGMDEDQPALCAGHAASEAQSFDAVKLPTPTLPLLLLVVEWPVMPDAALAGTAAGLPAPEDRPPPEPLFLATLRLRV